MSTRDWYRKTSWTTKDETDFFARLARTRNVSNKAQYLRVQAYHLVEDARPPLPSSALRLLDHLLQEFPSPLEIAPALRLKAKCFDLLNQTDEAVSVFRQVIAREGAFPNVKTGATVDFPFYIAQKGLTNLYDEAWKILMKGNDSSRTVSDENSPFPIRRFHFNTAAAFILDDRKEILLAKQYAQKALESASASHSDFSRHKNLGLVTDVPPHLLQKLKVISAKS